MKNSREILEPLQAIELADRVVTVSAEGRKFRLYGPYSAFDPEKDIQPALPLLCAKEALYQSLSWKVRIALHAMQRFTSDGQNAAERLIKDSGRASRLKSLLKEALRHSH